MSQNKNMVGKSKIKKLHWKLHFQFINNVRIDDVSFIRVNIYSLYVPIGLYPLDILCKTVQP